MICLISLSKFSDVFPAFNCARAIRNLSRMCFGVNIFNPFPCFPCITLLKALRINYRPLQRAFTFSKRFLFLSLFFFILDLDSSVNSSIFLINWFDLFKLHLYYFCQYKYYQQNI